MGSFSFWAAMSRTTDSVSRTADQIRDNWPETTQGRVRGSARDDDLDYTILGLHLLETYGEELTSWDVARDWLNRLPVHQTYTAERATYQNLVREVPLEAVGEFHNPTASTSAP